MNIAPACICGAAPARMRMRSRPNFGKRRLFECGGCAAVQLFPAPVEQAELDSIYQDAGYLSKIKRDEYYGYFKAFEEHLRLRLRLSKGIKLLDFGAGKCYYQKFFLEEGYRSAHSLEINRHHVRYATETLGLGDVYVSAEQLEPASYDLVISNQVFEHLNNPMNILESLILPLIKPNGLVCFSVPNWDSLNRPVLGAKWVGYSPEDHIWFFNERSIRRLLADVPGIELVDVDVRSAVGKPYDGFKPRGFVKQFYYRTFWRLFEMLGRGDQLIVTLRKKPGTEI